MLSFFSLVRNNPQNNVGAAGTLQDVNVAISRSKEKLNILGNFDMMLNGWTSSPADFQHGYKSPSRNLVSLIDHKYGKVVHPSEILIKLNNKIADIEIRKAILFNAFHSRGISIFIFSI